MRNQLSIFATLVLWFTTASFLIVGGTLFFLFRTFEQFQLREQSRTLTTRMHGVVAALSNQDDEQLDDEELARIRAPFVADNANRPRSGAGLVVRQGDRIVVAVGDVPPIEAFPPPSSDRTTFPVIAHDSGEQHFLLSSAAVMRGRRRYVIAMALNQTKSQEALEDFRSNTYIALFAGATFLTLAGAIVARRAMRPLAQITAATQTLDFGRLDQPVESDRWPAELRALGLEFARMQVRLRESFERLTQFSDDLAHEIRTPLNNLMGSAEVALRQARSPEEYRDTLSSMLEEAHRLRRMVDQLLFLSRAGQQENSLKRIELDAREEAVAVAEFFAVSAEEKEITLSVEGEASVFADRDLLRRALSNLVDNALQHTPAGGSVRIAVSVTAGGTRIEVHDTGGGIEARHLSRIFDRFYRVDDARSRYPEGTGLGLSIVRSIVELHRGTVTVSSTPRQGSIFTIELPFR
jgi:two-component system heavy metal sensor histidine kinase CusS